jgi:hypothetical protein
MEGNTLPETKSRKSNDGFGASLLLTDNEDQVFQNWLIPSKVVDVSTAYEIEKGKTLTLLIVFGGCGSDSKGNCDVDVDYIIYQPDGKVYADVKNVEVWQGKPAPPDRSIELSAGYLRIIIEQHEQVGTYDIQASVTDNVKKVTLLLNDKFLAMENE